MHRYIQGVLLNVNISSISLVVNNTKKYECTFLGANVLADLIKIDHDAEITWLHLKRQDRP